MKLHSNRLKWAFRVIAFCSAVCIGTTKNGKVALASIYSFADAGPDDEMAQVDLSSLPAIQANKSALMFTVEGDAIFGFGSFSNTMSTPCVMGNIIPDDRSVLLNYHHLRQANHPDRIRRGAVGGKPLVVKRVNYLFKRRHSKQFVNAKWREAQKPKFLPLAIGNAP